VGQAILANATYFLREARPRGPFQLASIILGDYPGALMEAGSRVGLLCAGSIWT
jgi:hypothetical protein